MGNISKDIMGANQLTTISLDLAIHEKAIQLAYSNNRLAAMYNFRLGELHISMAYLRGIGTYIENIGLDSIWIESNTYGPAVVRSIISCSHYKRCFNAHEVTIAALFHLLFKAFFLEHPEVKQRFCEVIEKNNVKKVRHVQILELFNEIEDVFEYFKANLRMKNMCKFFLTIWICSSDHKNSYWQLHLESCQKLSIDFHATDRINTCICFPTI